MPWWSRWLMGRKVEAKLPEKRGYPGAGDTAVRGAGARWPAHSPPRHLCAVPRHAPRCSSLATHRSAYKRSARARHVPGVRALPPPELHWAETPQPVARRPYRGCPARPLRAGSPALGRAGRQWQALPEPRALPGPPAPPRAPCRPRHAGSQLAAGQTTSWAGCQGPAPIPPPRFLTLSALAPAAQVGPGHRRAAGHRGQRGAAGAPAPTALRKGCLSKQGCVRCPGGPHAAASPGTRVPAAAQPLLSPGDTSWPGLSPAPFLSSGWGGLHLLPMDAQGGCPGGLPRADSSAPPTATPKLAVCQPRACASCLPNHPCASAWGSKPIRAGWRPPAQGRALAVSQAPTGSVCAPLRGAATRPRAGARSPSWECENQIWEVPEWGPRNAGSGGDAAGPAGWLGAPEPRLLLRKPPMKDEAGAFPIRPLPAAGRRESQGEPTPLRTHSPSTLACAHSCARYLLQGCAQPVLRVCIPHARASLVHTRP